MSRWSTNKLVGALTIALLLMMALPWAAFADDISNNLDTSIDAAAEVMPLNVGGANGSTQLYVMPRNGDDKNGCNLTAGSTLTVSVSSSDTAVATVSPSSVTFTACGDIKLLTVTPLAQGSATISVAQTANTTGATFNLAPATFAVNVAPPANTAPTVSVVGVTGGASYDKGAVPAATCQVADAEDGSSTFAATLSAITGADASDGIGQQTASCSYTDGGGLVATASETYSIIDPTAPTIYYTLNPTAADGANGWYNGNVSLDWSVTDSESPNSLAKTDCVDQSITADQAATTYSCSATSAGGSTGPVSVTIKRDGTNPVIADLGATAGPDVTTGWYISAVTNTFEASDATSGLATANPYQFTLSSGGSEGSAVKINSGSVVDLAGNSNPGIDSSAFKVDLSDPTNIAFVGGVAAGGAYYFGNVPAAPTCSADDAISGLASCVVSGYSNAVGPHTLTATATDNAGRTATDTLTYTVNPWTISGFYQPVDMSGVFNTVKGGSTVPMKFEVFAGTTELTNTSIATFSAKKVTCDENAPIDAVEMTATGGTSLRYDTTSGQFIYNWQTPKTAGSCYQVTLTTQDGSSILAFFKLK